MRIRPFPRCLFFPLLPVAPGLAWILTGMCAPQSVSGMPAAEVLRKQKQGLMMRLAEQKRTLAALSEETAALRRARGEAEAAAAALRRAWGTLETQLQLFVARLEPGPPLPPDSKVGCIRHSSRRLACLNRGTRRTRQSLPRVFSLVNSLRRWRGSWGRTPRERWPRSWSSGWRPPGPSWIVSRRSSGKWLQAFFVWQLSRARLQQGRPQRSLR